MVSFSCEACGDVLTKKKLDPHRNRCRDATYTCIDCMVYFPGFEYRAHTSCMTEEQKYQGALYKPKKQKSNQTGTKTNQEDTMAHRAYVEDATEEFATFRDFQVHESGAEGDGASHSTPPEVPMPPPAVADDANLNVFDYLLDPTPAASKINLPVAPVSTGFVGGRQLVRFGQDANNDVDESGYMVDDGAMGQYDTSYETPVPKAHRKKSKDGERDTKKDKKRKRLHIETSPDVLEPRTDEVMTDAPPVLHSGLTGGFSRMMAPTQFPPSPDYSGGDAADAALASPVKKKKQSKSPKTSRESLSSNLKALVSGSTKLKASKKRKHSEDKEKKRRASQSSGTDKKAPKLIEYKSKSGDENGDESGAMIVYRPRSDLFLSLCNKGPESDRGCSVNKALKRYHRERTSTGKSLSKVMEEKELWRSLRMRRNERGEIVLFSLDVE
ncbi:hypothetical protein GGR50DRAFT_575366 [Xylaria sp. CBS 124048]|nr:hypothetical protein GGR50DRAFT_575366 [Xylaria sp. CBS 124048]